MSRLSLLLALALTLCLGPGAIPPAAAFVIDQTSSGANLHWPASLIPVRYVINDSSLPVAGGATAVRAAYATWQAVPGTSIRFTDGGATTQTSAGPDGTNLIIWRSSNLDPDKFDPRTLAVTTTFFFALTGNISDTDIEFNSRDFTWGANGEPDRIDIQSVALHEIGHTIGFGHVEDSAAVMFPRLATGAQKRILTQDEIAAVRANYPGDSPPGPGPAPPPAPTPTPKPPPGPGQTPKPIGLEPPSGSIANPAIGPTLTFRWTSILGAAAYFFEHSGPGRRFVNPGAAAPDAVNGYGGVGGGLLVGGTTLTITLNPATPRGDYQWRVIALGPDGMPRGVFGDAATLSFAGQAIEIAPDITGTWDLVEESCCGPAPETRAGLSLVQRGALLDGTWNSLPITGSLANGTYEFGYRFDTFTTTYAVSVDGPSLAGTWTFTDTRTGYRSPPRPVRGTRR